MFKVILIFIQRFELFQLYRYLVFRMLHQKANNMPKALAKRINKMMFNIVFVKYFHLRSIWFKHETQVLINFLEGFNQFSLELLYVSLASLAHRKKLLDQWVAKLKLTSGSCCLPIFLVIVFHYWFEFSQNMEYFTVLLLLSIVIQILLVISLFGTYPTYIGILLIGKYNILEDQKSKT